MNDTPPTQYILAIAIGPVQEFIAASRKARDLFYGSDLLARISRKVALHLQNDHGAELIFPAPMSLNDKHAVANKIVAIVAGDPGAITDSAHAAASEVLTSAWTSAMKKVRERAKDGADAIDVVLAEKQVETFIEWYAAWVEYDPARYADARLRADRILAGRKTLRDFQPAAGVDMRPKSSLDPAREAVADVVDDATAAILMLRKNERLDAISLVKRTEGRHRFVSTARVAIDPFIRAAAAEKEEGLQNLAKVAAKLQSTDLVEEFNPKLDNLEHFGGFKYDTELCYAESVQNAIKELNGWRPRPTDPNEQPEYDALVEAVKEFYWMVDELGEGLPPRSTYFAVLRADGDRMGATLNALDTKGKHQHLSYHLGRFAKEAECIIAEHYGASIYTGGDDVLAFLPIDTCLPCADALQKKFATIMSEASEGQHWPDNVRGDSGPTLSVGLAIGHYSEHLQVLLQRSKEAEDKAKSGDKNALAVSFSAQSGGGDVRMVVHSWKEEPVQTFWATAIDAHRLNELNLPGGIPDRFAYELAALHDELASAFKARALGSDQVLHELLVLELTRILGRKRAAKGTNRIDQATIDNLIQRIKDTPDGKQALRALRKMSNEMIVARRIYPSLMDGRSGGLARWGDALADLPELVQTGGDQ